MSENEKVIWRICFEQDNKKQYFNNTDKNVIIKLLITVVGYFDDRLSYNNGITTNCNMGKINKYIFATNFAMESPLLFFLKFKSTVSNGNTSLHNYNIKNKHKIQYLD